MPATQGPPAKLKTDGFAIAALVLAILGGLLLSIIFGFVALNRIKKGKRKGKGIAVAALVISALWIVGIVVAVALGGGGSSDNASNFSGEKASIAAVIDEFGNTADNDAAAACATLTADMAAVYAEGSGTCESAIEAETEGKIQAELKISEITLVSARKATATVDEAGDALSMELTKRAGTWKIANIIAEE